MLLKNKKILLFFIIAMVLGLGLFILHSMRQSDRGAPSAALQEESIFVLRTVPANADVFVDGQFTGRSPLVVKLSKNKKVTITLKHQGYGDYVQEFDGASEHFQTTIKLEPESR